MFEARARETHVAPEPAAADFTPGRSTRVDPELEAPGWEDIGEDEATIEPAALKTTAPKADNRSRYATSHGKEMRNYRFKPGTRISTTVAGDQTWAPNDLVPG